MSRGVYYIVWGDYNHKALERSIESVKAQGYPIIVCNASLEEGEHFQKRHLLRQSPFKTTLYLDADTKVMGNIDFGFEMAEKHGIACCMAPASTSYHADGNDIRKKMPKDLPQYNCGVIFYDHKKSVDARRCWANLLLKHKGAIQNDQPYFAYALYQNLNPYVLPKNYNFRPHVRYESNALFGDLKILHSLKEWNQ